MPPWPVRDASGDGCASDRCDADTMNPRCENACGKLPIIRFASVSYSSEKMPTSFCRPRRRSNSSSASFSRPMSARLSTSQNVVSRNVPSPGGKTVDRVVVGGRVALHEPVDHQLALDGLDGADDPRIGRRQEADAGEHEQAGVELVGAVVLHEAVLLRVEALLADLGLDLVGDLAPAIDRHARCGRCCSAIFTARSNATHAITFDCVKWRCGPRISQMPSSGSCQTRSRCSIIAGEQLARLRVVRREVLRSAREPGLDAASSAASRDLAEHVELELLARLVADAHRLRVLVAGQPVELDLGEPAFAADAVHDLELAGVARDRTLQPVLPGAPPPRVYPLSSSAWRVSDESRSQEKR